MIHLGDYSPIFTSPKVTNCFSIITLVVIRENKIIDQFQTPKHQKIWLPFWKLLAFNFIITARWLKREKGKLLASHSALFSIIINVIILIGVSLWPGSALGEKGKKSASKASREVIWGRRPLTLLSMAALIETPWNGLNLT